MLVPLLGLAACFFEYLAAGRPILALAAGTEAGRIAAELGVEPLIRADDVPAITAALSQAATRRLPSPDPSASGRYVYPAAAEAMSDVLTRYKARMPEGRA